MKIFISINLTQGSHLWLRGPEDGTNKPCQTIPKKIFTAVLPAMPPKATSACFSMTTALLLATRSGRHVPIAIRFPNIMALLVYSNSSKQPVIEAKSTMNATNMPRKIRDTKKVHHPPSNEGGGIVEKIACNRKQNMFQKKFRSVVIVT